MSGLPYPPTSKFTDIPQCVWKTEAASVPFADAGDQSAQLELRRHPSGDVLARCPFDHALLWLSVWGLFPHTWWPCESSRSALVTAQRSP